MNDNQSETFVVSVPISALPYAVAGSLDLSSCMSCAAKPTRMRITYRRDAGSFALDTGEYYVSCCTEHDLDPTPEEVAAHRREVAELIQEIRDKLRADREKREASR